MTRFKKQTLKDKRKKPLTIAGTAMPSMMPSMDSNNMMGPTAPEGDMGSSMGSAQGFKKGGIISRGQGGVMKIKTTKYC